MNSHRCPDPTQHRLGSKGFTLIEVIIAITLMSFISLGIYQTTTETYRLRNVLSLEGDFYNSIRLSMDILQRDIAHLYTPTLLTTPPTTPTTPQDARDLEMQLGDLGKPLTFWGGAVDKTGLRPSRFQGSDTKFSFISSSHVRIYRDSPESDFEQITYELRLDKDLDGKPTQALFRIRSPNAFGDDETKDPYRRVYKILSGIKTLKFEYYRRDKERFEKTWDSAHPDFKNAYPDFIQITLEVEGPENLKHSGIYKFRPEMPVNGFDPSF